MVFGVPQGTGAMIHSLSRREWNACRKSNDDKRIEEAQCVVEYPQVQHVEGFQLSSFRQVTSQQVLLQSDTDTDFSRLVKTTIQIQDINQQRHRR